MQSDVLPFTMYDSMNYSSVQDVAPPNGFVHRDAPAVQSRTEQPREQIMSPPQQQAKPKQEATSQNDIDLDAYLDTSPKANDIGNYKNMKDLLYIIIAVLAVDVAVIFMTRYFPEVFGQSLNRWYDLFGLNAVIADVMIIFIGFLIARYIYTAYVKEKFAEGKWSPLLFTGTLVGTQLIHDLAFYFGIITQLPRGHNAMIDIFKDYAASGGAKILFGDALMCIASIGTAVILKQQPMSIVAGFGSLIAYALPYILYTKNQYSIVR
jgi:hypothetical protein